ncbi:uncharacterized protein LOC114250640 [Bombyx mandarina]|uniref:Uncharacterized protein LOC114250640 n=1 Tax=Bombyx mandarina TaxID=7092 RepID=A0A6J2KDK3_BOMMA|nr:uncharacterized protein LOC114250640 [Bombyx mandarina]
MESWFSLCLLLSVSCGVVKCLGIEQFWTDDYKTFENVYGKTSDKEIYGATLPPAVKQGVKREASEKKEHHQLKYDRDAFDIHTADTNTESKKPAISTQSFIKYTDFIPIAHTTDPENYGYLKQLENYEKDNSKFSAPFLTASFKSYPSNTYKSIRDIIESDQHKNTLDSVTVSENKLKNRPIRFRNDSLKSKCVSGRCNKLSSIRGTKPYVARIKHRIVKY